MNRWRIVVVLMLHLLAGPLRAEEPRAIIERAALAQVGPDNLGLDCATYLKLKGKVAVTKGQEAIAVEAEIFKEVDGKSKSVFQMTLGDMKVDFEHLFTGKDGWQNMGGKWEKMPREELEVSRISAEVDRIVSLLPLLNEKGFILAPLPETKVGERPAVGVKVSGKDVPEVQLYFDKETHFLCLYRYTTHDQLKNKDVPNEVVLGDYKELDFAARNEAVLKKAGVAVTDQGLLAFLKQQTTDPAVRERVQALIRQLGDDAFETREKAAEELVALGPVAVSALQAASKDKDPEVSRRADDCLKMIQKQTDPALVRAALQLVGLRRPAGAAEMLLSFIAGSAGALRQEAQGALWTVAQQKGEPDPVLVKALADRDPVRRSAAEAALGKDGGAFARQPRRGLFPKGLKQPMKITMRTDNETFLDVEVIDVQLFNRFEDSLFVQPE